MLDDMHLQAGTRASAGGVELELTRDEWRVDELEPVFTREESRDKLMLELSGGAEPVEPSTLVFSHLGEPAQFARAGTMLLRVDISSKNELRVRRLQLACPEAVEIPTLRAPTFLWLSTLGHSRVTVGPSLSRLLSLKLHPDTANPTLTATSEHAHLRQQIRPSDAGDAFTLDGASVEIVDVQSTETTYAGYRWHGEDTIPAVHVQLRIAPE